MVGARMVRKESKVVKISGGAVSLYLPAEVKHLHDLARQHPHLTCSEIYATALRSALGENEAKHPLEMMVDNQQREVEEIQANLESARRRLEASEERLPMELAKSEWMRHLLGADGLIQLRALRTWLFFDGSSWRAPVPQPKNGTQALATYKELLSKYEQTKRGPIVGTAFEMIEDLHPEHLKSGAGTNHCCEANQDVCGITERIKTENGWEDVLMADTEGHNLCDDLQFRCKNHLNVRILKHQGKEANEHGTLVDVPKLKPHWEEEELTAEQIAFSETNTRPSQHEGYLVQEKTAMDNFRRKSVIKWAIGEWENENPDEATILERLEIEKNTTAYDSEGQHLPTWKGMPAATGLGNNLKTRSRIIYSMTSEQKASYEADLKSYQALAVKRGESIYQRVRAWSEGGCVWPYAEMESWDDENAEDWGERTVVFSDDPQSTAARCFDTSTTSLVNAIEFDLRTMA